MKSFWCRNEKIEIKLTVAGCVVQVGNDMAQYKWLRKSILKRALEEKFLLSPFV